MTLMLRIEADFLNFSAAGISVYQKLLYSIDYFLELLIFQYHVFLILLYLQNNTCESERPALFDSSCT